MFMFCGNAYDRVWPIYSVTTVRESNAIRLPRVTASHTWPGPSSMRSMFAERLQDTVTTHDHSYSPPGWPLKCIRGSGIPDPSPCALAPELSPRQTGPTISTHRDSTRPPYISQSRQPSIRSSPAVGISISFRLLRTVHSYGRCSRFTR
jgi:hypothetical protein